MIDRDSFSSVNGGPDLRELYGRGQPHAAFSASEATEIEDILMLMAATRGEDALSEICLPGLDHRIWPPGADADASSVVHSIGIANEAGRLLFKLEKKHGYFSSIEYRKV